MRKQDWIVKAFEIALILAIVIAGFGSAVWQLWNWLMPDLFGMPSLAFWQAVGLLGLSWILFGGLRGFGMIGRPARRSAAGLWEGLTPEQREKFRQGLQARSHIGQPPAQP
ncbi:MAG: hypothetical protein ACRD5F_13045 [Candidatus Acidiferrales bacterium]